MLFYQAETSLAAFAGCERSVFAALKFELTFVEGVFELLERFRERKRRFIFLHQFIQVNPGQQIWK